MRLNTELIRRRRRELRLSERYLAERLGTSRTTVRWIESGEAAGGLTLDFIAELGEMLAIPFADLVIDTAPQAPAKRGDAERLGAMLAEAAEPTPLDVAAEVLGWTPERTRRAGDELAAVLTQAGMVLRREGDELLTLPAAAVLSGEELRERARRHLAKNHLSSHEASVLLAYVERDLDAVRKLGGREFTALGLLAKAGLIQDGPRGSGAAIAGMGVAEEVAFSLMV